MADIRLSDKSSLGVVVTALSGATTVDVNKEYRLDSSGGAFTVTLPDVTRSDDKILLVDEAGSLSTNAVTVSADPSDTIDGSASFVMDFDNSILELRADAGTNNWVIVKFTKFTGGEIDTNSLVDTAIDGSDELAYYDVSGGKTAKRSFTNMLSDLGVGSGSGPINSFTDVDTTTTAPSVGDILVWDGSNWVPDVSPAGHVEAAMTSNFAVPDSTSFTDVPGLSITIPSDGDWWIIAQGQSALTWNNTATSVASLRVSIFDGLNVAVPDTNRRACEINGSTATTDERNHSGFSTSAIVTGVTAGTVYKLRARMNAVGRSAGRQILAFTEECIIRAVRIG